MFPFQEQRENPSILQCFLKPLFLKKKVGLFKKEYSNCIIPLLPSDEEEEDDSNEVSANLMVQLDNTVELNAPASPKPSSPPTDLVTHRTSLVLPTPSAMVSSELDLLKDEVAALRIQREEDAKTFRVLLTKVGKQERPSANQSNEMDALRAEKQHALEKENLQRMLDAKTKEAFDAKLAEKDAQIKALTAAKAGKTCVEDDEDDGDGEDENNDGDGRVSELTNRSPKQKPSNPDNKDDLIATIKSELIALRKKIKDFGIATPECTAKMLTSKDGMNVKMVDGSIQNVKIINSGKNSPVLEVKQAVPSPAAGKMNSSFSFGVVYIATPTDIRKFCSGQIRAATESPWLSGEETRMIVGAIQDFENWWELIFRQTLGPHHLIKGNANRTQFSDSALVGAAAFSSFQEALLSEAGISSIVDVSDRLWSRAAKYSGSSNGGTPHELASYLQAAKIMMIQCPACAQVGCTETHCFECNNIPAALSGSTPKISTNSFIEYCKQNPGARDVQETKYKEANSGKSPYVTKAATKPLRKQFQDHMDTRQNENGPASQWA